MPDRDGRIETSNPYQFLRQTARSVRALILGVRREARKVRFPAARCATTLAPGAVDLAPRRPKVGLTRLFAVVRGLVRVAVLVRMTGRQLHVRYELTVPQAAAERSPHEPRPKSPRRNERPQTANVLMWLIVGLGAIVVAAYFFMNDQHKGKVVTLGEFESGIEDGIYRPTNVFDLRIAPGYIRFQDQPVEKRSSGGDESKPVHVRPCSDLHDGERKREAELTRAVALQGNRLQLWRASPPDWQNLLVWIPGIVILLVMMYFLRRMVGTGAAMSFGRSRGRLYAQEDIDITFADAAGIDEAVNELREVVEFLRTPGKYKALGGRIPRGVLLVGPPGTGKTLLAKAVAGRGRRPVLQPVRFGLRRNVRRRRRRPRAGHVPPGRPALPEHHLHRRARRPRQSPRQRCVRADTTSASRRSTRSWSKWTASPPIKA